jgi:hypothetical protein
MSIEDPFDKVAETNDSDNPLGDEDVNPGNQETDDYVSPQRECEIVGEIHRLKYGSYDNSKGGTSYFFVCEYEVRDIIDQGDHTPRYGGEGLSEPEDYERNGIEHRELREGDLLQFFQQMPNPAIPFPDLDVGEQMDWGRIFECGGAVKAIPSDYMQVSALQDLCVSETSEATEPAQDVGKKVGDGGGALIGIDVDIDVPSDGQYTGQRFTRHSFFPVVQPGEEGETGTRKDWLTEAEIIERFAE